MKVQQKQSHWIIILVNNIVVLVLITLLFFVPFGDCQQRNAPSSPPDDGYVMEKQLKVDPRIAIIFVCLVTAFFMMGCVSVYGRQCIESRMGIRLTSIEDQANQATRQSQRSAALRGLDAAVIGAFPTFLYSDVKGHKIGKVALECAVCLNEFEDGETLRLVPKCCHVFHPDCIGTWLASHVTCPVCRANLVPVLGEESESNDVLCCESVTESTQPTRSPEVRNQVHEHEISELAIDLHVSSPEVINASQTINQKRSSLSILKSPEIYEKFSRSHSTGHSLIQPGEDCERFTLRLPEDVQKKLMQPELRRVKSNVAFPSARSSKKGYRSNSVGTGRERNNHRTYYERFDRGVRPDRWGFTMTPPFISWTGSTSSPKEPVGGNNLTASGSLFKSVKSPFDRLFGATEKDDVGERSFTRLTENNPV